MRFKTSIALTLLLAILGCVFFALGQWQLQRGAEKAAIQDAVENAPVLTTLTEDAADFARLTLRGSFDANRPILRDNRVFQGRAGVEVLMAFTTTEKSASVLVNRGWLPMVPDRSTLPTVTTPEGEVEISGRLGPLGDPGVQLGTPQPLQATNWPQLIVYPDLKLIESVLGLDLNRQILYLDDTSQYGFQDRDWTPYTMGPDRHKAYAVQWFGLSLTAIIIWLVLGFTAGRRAAS